MANQNRENIISGDISKVLKSLTIQMLFGTWGIVAFNLADAYFIGKLGTLQMAALTFTFPVVLVVNSLSLGLAIGTSSILSHAVGGKDKKKTIRLSTDSILLGVIISLIVVLVGELSIEPLFRALGADNSTLPFITQYMRIWYLCIPITTIQMISNNILRGLGDVKNPSLIMLLASVLNIILDPLLINGMGVFPNLSVAGAAAATLFSRMITFLIAFLILAIREKVISIKSIILSELIVSWKEVLYIGLPNSTSRMIIPIGAGIITGLISKYGNNSVAGFGIATKIEFFALSLIQSLTTIIPVFVGQNFGAKKFDRVFRGIRISEKFSFINAIVIYCILFFAATPLAHIFTKSQEVAKVTVLYMRIVPLGYFFYSVLLIINASLNALKKPIHGAALSASQMFVFYIPLAFIMSRYFEIKGIFIALLLSYIISGIISHIYINYYKNSLVLKWKIRMDSTS